MRKWTEFEEEMVAHYIQFNFIRVSCTTDILPVVSLVQPLHTRTEKAANRCTVSQILAGDKTEQNRQCTCNDHCYHGKRVSTTYSECIVCYPACNAHAPYYNAACVLSGSAFLGEFVKFRKTTISFVMSVRLSAWNSAPTGRILMKLDIWDFFENLYRKFRSH